jgi:hypothetical protein
MAMTDFTYEKVAAAAPAAVSPKTPQKSLVRRIYDRVLEARMRQAEQVVRQYQELARRD